jgi:PAS domain S-box-containing protein
VRRGEGGLLRRLFDRAPDGLLVTRLRDGRIVMANEAVSRLLGCEHSDLIAATTEEIGLWRDDDREQFVKLIREERSTRPREVRIDTPTGTRWIEVSDELMTLGGRSHVLATLHDVTDRKLAEQALRAERDHYAALVAALQDGYYVIANNGAMIDVNDRFCEMTGYSREEALAMSTPGPWWPAEYRESIMAARREVMKTGCAEFDWPLQHRDGHRFHGHVTSAVMHDADGEISGIVVTVRNVDA